MALALCAPVCARAAAPDLPAVERQVVERTNVFRRSEGREALRVDGALARSAREFAEYMARSGRYGHTADGREPSERARASGYDYCRIAENISYQYSSHGFGTAELATRLVDGWKRSPGHRANMLDATVTETAVALARDRSGRYYAVQLFGLPRSARIEFRVRNESGIRVRYRIGEEEYTLAPREGYLHQRCGREQVALGKSSVEPRDGDQLVIGKAADGLEVRRAR